MSLLIPTLEVLLHAIIAELQVDERATPVFKATVSYELNKGLLSPF